MGCNIQVLQYRLEDVTAMDVLLSLLRFVPAHRSPRLQELALQRMQTLLCSGPKVLTLWLWNSLRSFVPVLTFPIPLASIPSSLETQNQTMYKNSSTTCCD